MSETTSRIGVVGAGVMGSGIAQKFAMEGFPVVLCDLNAAQTDKGMARIRQLLSEGIERKALTPAAVAATLDRLHPTSDRSALAGCELIVEAVFEDLQVKREVFADLDLCCGPETILASNTSSFLVRELARGLGHPERVVGLHFFFHPVKNRLVEVIPGPSSTPEVLRRAWDLMAAAGKTPIATADAPGFCVNRFFVPWLNEAVRMLDEGTASIAAVEAAAKEHFRIGMGPFELMNVTGVPIAYHAAVSLGDSLGEFYRPAIGLARQFESGTNWPLDGPATGAAAVVIADRLFAAAWAVAGQIVDEGVASLEDVDRGAKIGLRWSLGPFEWMNRRGVAQAAQAVTDLAAHSPGLVVAHCLVERAAAGQPWRFNLVDSRIEDGIAHLFINRPEALNALNADVLAQLEAAFDAAAADPGVHGIVVRGTGKAFVAGADVRFFVKAIEAGRIADITAFTRRAQVFYAKIAACPKPVTAVVHGLALGGGAELALTAHRIVATHKGSLGFPETGIGIYPALGGTFRTTRRVGAELARYLLLTGRIVPAQDAFDMGLVDVLVHPLEIEKTLAKLAAAPAPQPTGSRKGLADLREAFTGNPPALLAEGYVAEHPQASSLAKAVGSKAPVAVRLALGLIDQNRGATDSEGYANELAHIETVFATHDALIGLRSAGRERPVFTGE